MITRKDLIRFIAQILGNEYNPASSDSWNIRGWDTNKPQIIRALNERFFSHFSFYDLDYNNADQFINTIINRISVVDRLASSKEELNIIITGKSGAGKSSFLNYLIDEDHFKVGDGSPVTQAYFEDYVYVDSDTHVKYHLYDTKGIEPTTTSECCQQVFDEIERRDKLSLFEWIHTVYYCFDASAKRIQPFELNFIKQLISHVSIVVLLTKKDLVTQTDLNSLIQQIQKEIDNSIQIIPVCSVAKTTRKGSSMKEGRNEVLSASFFGLWNKLANSHPQRLISPLYDKVVLHFGDRVDSQTRESFKSSPEKKREIYELENNKMSLSFLCKFPEWNDLPQEKFVIIGLMESANSFIKHIGNFLSHIDSDDSWKSNERIHSQIFAFYQKVNRFKPSILYTNEAKNAFANLSKYDLKSKVSILEGFVNKIDKLWEEWKDTWIFDSNERSALINQYHSYRRIVVELAHDLMLLVNNYVSAYRTELLQYGQYCIKKETKIEDVKSINSESELDKDEIIYCDVLKKCLADRCISENERYVLDALIRVLNISYTRAGFIEDFVRRNL